MEDSDPLIGEIFEDRDSRMAGRRIKVISAFQKQEPGSKRTYLAYRVETVLAPNWPGSVGNRSSVGAEQLLKRYRKVSH